MTDTIDDIARAVLYEGYLLWPYRRSALKNTQRWTFGGVYPDSPALAACGDRAIMQTECLLEGPADATLDVRVRFLQVVRRNVQRADGRSVDALESDGARHLAWDEAREREVRLPRCTLASLRSRIDAPFMLEQDTSTQPIADGSGAILGSVIRGSERVEGTVEALVTPLEDGVTRLRVTIANTTPWSGDDRRAAQRYAFLSTHVVLRLTGAAFLSLTDPPERVAAQASACVNVGCWPVLVGTEGSRDTVLAAPIILADYPRVAPESPGDFFDAGEIDQLLVLNVLALTDEEQREMRDTDPRAREILDRCATLPPEVMSRLHGAIRDFHPAADG
jgi:hypothetical protein